VNLERDFFKLIDFYFEETVIALQKEDLSELTRYMGAFFLIEEAYKYLATEEEMNELFEINGNHASSIHYFFDVITEVYPSFQPETRFERFLV
jgi:hypothetical protein